MENMIAYHCAPALAGIKPSNIVSCHKRKISDVHGKIAKFNREFNQKGIFFEAVCECERRVVLMVYRKNVLENALSDEDVREFLASFGYPKDATLEKSLEFLKKRLLEKDFPHEIGVFLGYPLHDIYGFLNHKKEGCLLCGEWKVYENVEEAKRLFRRFADCRNCVLKRVKSGQKLSEIFKS